MRLPLAGEDDIGKIARAVNLMLDDRPPSQPS